MKSLVVKNLVKRYHAKIAVNDLNFSIKGGQFVAFLGPNGAGKSTTINMLTGMLPFSSGEITMDNLHPSEQGYRQKLGVVFQNSVLDSELSVGANLTIRAGMYHTATKTWLNELIRRFQLSDILKQKYGTLSGGQKRRVDIARALVNKPEILFLDEPSTGLDIQTRQLIWEVLADIRKIYQMTVVLTTHYLEEAEVADVVYVIDHGNLLIADTLANLKQKYSNGTLTLITDNHEDLQQKLKNYKIKVTNDGLELQGVGSDDALSILQSYTGKYSDFEYRRGNMNDIFIALTGQEVRK